MTSMSLTTADQLRDFVSEYFLSGSARGQILSDLADQAEDSERERARVALYALMSQLERIAALSCPAADLAVAVDHVLDKYYPKAGKR